MHTKTVPKEWTKMALQCTCPGVDHSLGESSSPQCIIVYYHLIRVFFSAAAHVVVPEFRVHSFSQNHNALHGGLKLEGYLYNHI